MNIKELNPLKLVRQAAGRDKAASEKQMKIVIVGLGKVGQTLARELSGEDNEITVIDRRESRVQDFSNQFDIMGIVGNGINYSTQIEAGVAQADLLIAVTGSDELNMLCCLIARKAGSCHTIARVRNPEYRDDITYIQEELGLAMVINPELAAAEEIARVLKYPSAIEVDSFAKSKVELLKFRVPVGSALANQRIADISAKLSRNILICVIERENEVLIPNGNTILREKDLVSIVGPANDANAFFRQAGLVSNQVKTLLITGGGTISFYLARALSATGINVKIIEKDEERCLALNEKLPDVSIVCGDGTDKDVLEEEDLAHVEAFAAITNIDEENVLLSLYAKKVGCGKVITRINRIAFDEVIRELDLDTVIYPKDITAERIIRYVRTMRNSLNSNNVETLHRMNNNKVEALEFIIRESSAVTDVPLSDLKMRTGFIIACISRNGKTVIPRGQDMIRKGDNVIVVTRHKGLDDILDILEA